MDLRGKKIDRTVRVELGLLNWSNYSHDLINVLVLIVFKTCLQTNGQTKILNTNLICCGYKNNKKKTLITFKLKFQRATAE